MLLSGSEQNDENRRVVRGDDGGEYSISSLGAYSIELRASLLVQQLGVDILHRTPLRVWYTNLIGTVPQGLTGSLDAKKTGE
jgi:hypothetical protein